MSIIVRILHDNQYRVPDDQHGALTTFEDALEVAFEHHDGAAFSRQLTDLIHHVKHVGQPVPHHEIVTSDIVLPPADCTLEEFKSLEKKHVLSQ